METVHKVKAGQVFHSLSIAETETNRHQSLCVDLWSGCDSDGRIEHRTVDLNEKVAPHGSNGHRSVWLRVLLFC